MKAKSTTFLAGVMVLMIVLLMGYQTAAAAPPAGEVKTVTPALGNGVPVPHLETAQANDWMHLLYDHLVGCTPQGKISPDLGLAHKWEMSPDGLIWTFYLRKGVKFHDGVEMTAKDVKFSIELLMRPDCVSENAPFIRREVKSVEVKDPYTVVIHCKRPYIFLLSLLNNAEGTDGMVVPKDYYERVGQDEFAKHPIGTGPYKWHSQMVNTFIKLESVDKHWRAGVPRYKYMTFLVIPEESTRMAMLKTGEADITRVSRDGVKDVLNSGLNVITKENAAILYFQPNMQWTSPAFSDVRFRKALNLAVDKEAIIKQIFAGFPKPLSSWPGPNISAVGGDPTLKAYPYDPQEAKRLIKEGGWEGYEFTMVKFDRAGCPEIGQVVETLAGYWQGIGLKPKIRTSEWSIWRLSLKDRKSQNTIHGTDGTTNPDIPTLLIKLEERYDFASSYSMTNTPELNQKFERIRKSMDVAEISKLMAEIYRYAYDNYMMIPICVLPDKIATTKRIPKWDPGVRRGDRNYYDLIKQ